MSNRPEWIEKAASEVVDRVVSSKPIAGVGESIADIIERAWEAEQLRRKAPARQGTIAGVPYTIGFLPPGPDPEFGPSPLRQAAIAALEAYAAWMLADGMLPDPEYDDFRVAIENLHKTVWPTAVLP